MVVKGTFRIKPHREGDLLVPFALAGDNNIVTPADVKLGAPLSCPGCEEKVILRAVDSDHMSPHFAHLPNTSCHSETYWHRSAKWLIHNAVRDQLNGSGRIITCIKMCLECDGDIEHVYEPREGHVQIDYRTSEGYISDVVILMDNVVVEVIHIRWPGRRADDDMPRFIPASGRYIVLDVQDVIKDPFCWRPKSTGPASSLCDRCGAHKEAYRLIPSWARDLRGGLGIRTRAWCYNRKLWVSRREFGSLVIRQPIVELDFRAGWLDEWQTFTDYKSRHEGRVMFTGGEHLRQIQEALQEHRYVEEDIWVFWWFKTALDHCQGKWLIPMPPWGTPGDFPWEEPRSIKTDIK